MSISFSEKHMALYQFSKPDMFGSRELIEGLRLQKDKFVDDFDGKPARPYLKGSKDTNEIIWKKSSNSFKEDNLPVKPCLMVPKEEGSNERIEVRKAKTVHFADSCGLALTSVATLFDNEEELFAFRDFSRSKGLVIRNSFPSFGNKNSPVTDKKSNKILNFIQPVTSPNFQQKIAENNVSLENVVLRDYSIFGTIRVANIDFEKNVLVRYTIDNWQNCQNAQGTYISGTSTGKTDSFSFEIPISGDGKGESVNVEFCVCYETRIGSFWDNNNNQNYKILFYPLKPSEAVGDSSDGFILCPKRQQFAGLSA